MTTTQINVIVMDSLCYFEACPLYFNITPSVLHYVLLTNCHFNTTVFTVCMHALLNHVLETLISCQLKSGWSHVHMHTALEHNELQLPPVHLNLIEQKAKPSTVLLKIKRS